MRELWTNQNSEGAAKKINHSVLPFARPPWLDADACSDFLRQPRHWEYAGTLARASEGPKGTLKLSRFCSCEFRCSGLFRTTRFSWAMRIFSLTQAPLLEPEIALGTEMPCCNSGLDHKPFSKFVQAAHSTQASPKDCHACFGTTSAIGARCASGSRR